MEVMEVDDVLCLFDLDGTLTRPRKIIEPEVLKFLQESIKPNCNIAVVGGSDFDKISEQLGGSDMLNLFDYVFAENGLVAFKNNRLIGQGSIQAYLGEQRLQELINYCLYYLSQIELPFKRGTFIEFRKGVINISPVGRSCTAMERDQFEIYDNEHKIRETFIKTLEKDFSDWPLKYSIGGQISFDVFPKGWDKTYCLRYLTGYKQIHFFGDKTFQGGNDYEIFESDKVIGHSVKDPTDTILQLLDLFKKR